MSDPCIDSKDPTSGFALVDILVALALLGVISSLMIVFLGQARSIMRIDTLAGEQMEIDAAARFLEATIAKAEPLPLLGSAPQEIRYLSGSSSSLLFSAIQPVGFGTSALRQVMIAANFEKDSALLDDGALSLKLTPRRADPVAREEETEIVPLINPSSTISFEYLDGSASSAVWSTEWVQARKLPVAIRFTVATAWNGQKVTATGLARLRLAKPALSKR